MFDSETAHNFFQPLRLLQYVHITMIVTYAAPLSGEGTFPCDQTRCNSFLHTNAAAIIATPDIIVKFEYICVSELWCMGWKLMYLLQSLHRRDWETLRRPISRPSTLHSATSDMDLPTGHHYTLPGHSQTECAWTSIFTWTSQNQHAPVC